MSQGHFSWATLLAPPVGYLLSPIFGFSLASYGPALMVSVTSIFGIALKYLLDDRARNKAHQEDERIRQRVREEWQSLVDKPRSDWRTGEYRFAEDLLRTLKERRDELREEGDRLDRLKHERENRGSLHTDRGRETTEES